MEQDQKTNVCPICQQANHCDVQNAQQCWCMTVTIPKELIVQLPKELQGEQCICKQCIMNYNNLNRK